MALKVPKIKVSRFAVIMAVAVVLAGAAAYLSVNYLRRSESSYRQRVAQKLLGRLAQVVVPTLNLAPGTVASAADMALRYVPRDLIYPTTITTANWRIFAGHRLTRAVQRGLPLLTVDFEKPYGGDFAATMPKDMRAITVDVNGENRIAGLIRPGDRVDLLVIVNQSGGSGRLIPVIHRALVVATGKHTRFTPIRTFGPRTRYVNQIMSQYASLTLELNPVQAARVAIAQKVGQLRVILTPKKSLPTPRVPMLTGAAILSGITARAGSSAPPTVEYIVGQGTARVKMQSVNLGQPMPAPQAARPTPLSQTQKTLKSLQNYLHEQRKAMQKSVNENPDCPPYCGAPESHGSAGEMPR
jgi:pilus assembly protein CpaB